MMFLVGRVGFVGLLLIRLLLGVGRVFISVPPGSGLGSWTGVRTDLCLTTSLETNTRCIVHDLNLTQIEHHDRSDRIPGSDSNSNSVLMRKIQLPRTGLSESISTSIRAITTEQLKKGDSHLTRSF